MSGPSNPFEELRAEIRAALDRVYPDALAHRVLDRALDDIGWAGAKIEELPTVELLQAVLADVQRADNGGPPAAPALAPTKSWQQEELERAGLSAAPAPPPTPAQPAASAPAPAAPAQTPAQAAARDRQAMGAKGWRRAQNARKAQVRAQAKAQQQGTHHYTDGGFYRMPNLLDSLLPAFPAPVLKAYLVSCRLADVDGTFEISHQSLGEWIGSKHRTHGERAMRRLIDAGLLHQRWRGGPGRPNGYRLVSLAKLDLETTKVILSQPLTLSGANKHRGRVHRDGRASSDGHAACA